MALPLFLLPEAQAGDFVNFETPTVHPLDLSPDGTLLAVAHVADDRVELFQLGAGNPTPLASIPVGDDPVSVRFRSNGELWVVNHISDTISIVDVANRVVANTLTTEDEPADVVFAGNPARAYVTCAQESGVLVFNLAELSQAPTRLAIDGEEPRALAVSADGTKVFAAIFESGNSTTVLAGGGDGSTINFPPNAVSDSRGPYGGTNPPPNKGNSFVPAQRAGNPAPPKVGLIVRKDAAGLWKDDNNRDWTSFVSGPLASASGRITGWDVMDNDIAIIDTATHAISYATRLMNIGMAIAVRPGTGEVTLVGTEAKNEIRFEPNLNGKFVRVQLATVNPANPTQKAIADLNPHLTYATSTVAQAERDKSLGDPRAIAWKPDGSKAYVAGMGSNNVIVVNPNGSRGGLAQTINVGEGPAGLVVDAARNRLYVLNRFEGSLSVISLATETEIARIAFFDPTPQFIKNGRKFLYDTRRTSGLGHVSCASCHVDARIDRLGWDLGDPSATVKNVTATLHNRGAGIPGLDPTNPLATTQSFTHFHPMKGPMTTQTLQDIIGREPHHWRGDRNGLEEFNSAFTELLGDDVALTAAEMQQFEDFLSSIHFPPNPYRNLDNSLPTNLPLPGHFKSGRFGNAGQPMPNGNAVRALTATYRPLNRGIDQGAFACVTCHTVPTGMGTDNRLTIGFGGITAVTPIAPGPNGERHHMMVSVDGSTQRAFKVPQTRNMGDKVGMEFTQPLSRAGFGFAHDGSVDSLTRFFSEGAFAPNDDQEIADLVALMLSFSGSGFGSAVDAFEPPGTASQDAHAAVGKQVRLISNATATPEYTRLSQFITLANANAVQLIAKSSIGGRPRGWLYIGSNNFQTDQKTITESLTNLLVRATPNLPVTFTVVPKDAGQRIGVERDRDGLFDFDEVRDLALNVPGVQNPFRPDAFDSTGNNGSIVGDGISDGNNDFDGDGVSNAAEFAAGTNPADNLAIDTPLNLTVTSAPGLASVTLSFDTAPNAEYLVRFSSDLMVWTPAGNGTIRTGSAGGRQTWIDNGPPRTPSPPSAAARRFYEVERLR